MTLEPPGGSCQSWPIRPGRCRAVLAGLAWRWDALGRDITSERDQFPWRLIAASTSGSSCGGNRP